MSAKARCFAGHYLSLRNAAHSVAIQVATLAVLLLGAAPAFAQTWISWDGSSPGRPPDVVLDSGSATATTFHVTVHGFYIEDVVGGPYTFQRVTIPDYDPTTAGNLAAEHEVGLPELPYAGTLVGVVTNPTSAFIQTGPAPEFYVLSKCSGSSTQYCVSDGDCPDGESCIATPATIYPAQPDLKDCEASATCDAECAFPGSFRLDDAFYGGASGFFPAENVNVEPLVQWTTLKLAPVRVNLAQFDPETLTLRVMKSVSVTVAHGGSLLPASVRPDLCVGSELLYDAVLNFQRIKGYFNQIAARSYLVIVHDDFAKEMAPFEQAKQKEGFTVTHKQVPRDIAKDRNAIRTAIRNFFVASKSLSCPYVLLVGDVDRIPTGQYTQSDGSDLNGPSDTFYALVNPAPPATDKVPDLFVGRVSADTTRQVRDILQKILRYERTPLPGNWLKTVVLASHKEGVCRGGTDVGDKCLFKCVNDAARPRRECGSNAECGANGPCGPVAEGKYSACAGGGVCVRQYEQNQNQVKANILDNAPPARRPMTTLAPGGGQPTAAGNNFIESLLNVDPGVGVLGYRGHGSSDEWANWSRLKQPTTSWTTSEVTSADIKDTCATPVVFSLACLTNRITCAPGDPDPCPSDSLGEEWVQSGANRGAVAHYGSTQEIWTTLAHEHNLALFDNLYTRGVTQLGPLILRSQLLSIRKNAVKSLRCAGGTRDMLSCRKGCPDSTTSRGSCVAGTCVGGTNNGLACCPGGACALDGTMGEDVANLMMLLGDPALSVRTTPVSGPACGNCVVEAGETCDDGNTIDFDGCSSTCNLEVLGNAVGEALASCDFNGDGFADLAVGVPHEDVGGNADAGVVKLVYGSPRGLSAANTQLISQDTPEVEGFAEAGDNFGSALAAGDFNHDGFCDLAVGIPGEDLGTIVDAGAVQILYGSPGGLSTANDQLWDQNKAESATVAVEGVAEPGDHFGAALAAGDFNGDGFADLAIGVPDEDVGSRVDAGAVNVLYGTAHGISAVNDQLWNQNSANVQDYAERGDHFGAALATGDFNGDGFADLAIGVPDEDVGTIVDAGAVNVLYGTAARGLYTVNDQIWHQNSSGIEGFAARADHFGSALAAGDFNGDGFADLAIGVPGDDVGSVVDAGAVNVIYGTRSRLSYLGDQIWTQDKIGVGGSPEPGDHFGSAVTAGDFDHDGFSDLAIGIPDESIDGAASAGAVQILYGTRARLTGDGGQLFSQNTTGIAGVAGAGDRLGAAVTADDFNGDGFSDLAVGVPGEDVNASVDNGAVNVLYGLSSGLSSGGNQLWTEGTSGLQIVPQ